MLIQHQRNYFIAFYKSKINNEIIFINWCQTFIEPMENDHFKEVAESSKHHNKFLKCNLGHSKIDDKCCESLSQCEIPQLNQIYLVKCGIS